MRSASQGCSIVLKNNSKQLLTWQEIVDFLLIQRSGP
jgi:hypothetical protein